MVGNSDREKLTRISNSHLDRGATATRLEDRKAEQHLHHDREAGQDLDPPTQSQTTYSKNQKMHLSTPE